MFSDFGNAHLTRITNSSKSQRFSKPPPNRAVVTHVSKNPPVHHKNCLQRVANGTRAHEAGVSKLRAPAWQVYLLFGNIFARLRRTVPASNWRPKLGQFWLISGD
jgi:hypothetical protein